MSNSQTPPVGTQEERDLDSRLDAATTTSSSLIEEAFKHPSKLFSAPEEETDEDDDILTPFNLATSRSIALIPYNISNSQTPPVGTQEERDLDSRLDAAITNSSSLIEEALKQLSMPCSAPEDETDEYDDILTPIDLAISRSTALLEEAREQLSSPTFAPLEITELEVTEDKATQAWLRTYRQIEQTNDVRSDAGEDLAKSILNDIEEADESGDLYVRPHRPMIALRSMSDFAQSSSSFREEKRAKRRSRLCGGPKVAAVVAKIEAIDDSSAPDKPPKVVAPSALAEAGSDGII